VIGVDIVIFIANIFFCGSLIYQVYYGFKIKKSSITLFSSFLSFSGLFAIAISFLVIGLYLSALVTAINGFLWLTLFFQRIIFFKKKM